MLQHAAIVPHGSQGGGEATTILAEAELMGLARCPVPIPAPALAGWVRHHRPWPGIGAGVPALVPRINPRDAEICSIGFDVEGGDHHTTPRTAAQRARKA
jgi:hypothetical protein